GVLLAERRRPRPHVVLVGGVVLVEHAGGRAGRDARDEAGLEPVRGKGRLQVGDVGGDRVVPDVAQLAGGTREGGGDTSRGDRGGIRVRLGEDAPVASVADRGAADVAGL